VRAGSAAQCSKSSNKAMAVVRSTDAAELIELAAVVRAHGLRGDLLLKRFNPSSDVLVSLKRVFLKYPDGRIEEHESLKGHVHGLQLILTLAAVRGKEAADAVRGAVVCVTRADLPEPPEEEHYLVDLVGLAARNAAGVEVGRVVDVLEYPSIACLVVEGADGQTEVPNTERYVLAIDVASGSITLDHLDELDILRSAKAKGRP
jgi:16S rRNA processing protein RimM